MSKVTLSLTFDLLQPKKDKYQFLILWLHLLQSLLPRALLVYRYESVVLKEAEGQGHFRVTRYIRTNYIALNLPYSTGLVFL